MQMSPAIASDFLTISAGGSCEFASSASAAACEQPVLGLEHVAVAGDDERGLPVRDGEHRLEPAQHAVGAPVLGELHRALEQLSLVLLELGLEPLEEGERVGRGAREAREHAVLVEAAHLAGGGLHDDVAEGHLAVAAHGDLVAAAHAEDGGAVELRGVLGHGMARRGGRGPQPGL